MKALCICEKQSLMTTIKEVYEKISFPDQVDFVALSGHVVELYYPEDYDDKYKKWDKNLLPIFPEKWLYKNKPAFNKLIVSLKKQLSENHYDYLINATDAEREGQNIFYSLYKYLGIRYPVKRLWIHDLNFEPIKEALENMKNDLRDPFLVNLTRAGLCRAYADWLVGINFSRATSQRIGRVKSPTLEILYKREVEIQNYKEEIHYQPLGYFGDSGIIFAAENDKEFVSSSDCSDFLRTLGAKGTVTDFSLKTQKEKAPLLFSLGELQSESNKAYGYTLSKTLEIVQTLYESKILTYPRTDCPYISTIDSEKLYKFIPSLIGILDLEVNDLLPAIPDTYVNDKEIEAHGAIIFTCKDFNMNKLSEEQQNIVTLVGKRIISVAMNPAVYEKKKMTISVKSNDGNSYEFKTSGSVNKDLGWKELYVSKTKNTFIPTQKKGDVLNVSKYGINKKVSTKPERYNDSSLIKAMINVGNTLSEEEKNILKGKGDRGGIGTPATRSKIVDDLVTAEWAERKGKSFYLTSAGITVADAIKDRSFASASLTAEWEQKLNMIVEQKMTQEQFMSEIYDYVGSEVKDLVSSPIKVYAKSICKCPVCKSDMYEGKNNYYCKGCAANPKTCKFSLSKKMCGANITANDVIKICEGKKTRKLKMKSPRTGNSFNASLMFDEESLGVKFVFENTKKEK